MEPVGVPKFELKPTFEGVFLGCLGVGSAMLFNVMRKRPYYASVPRQLLGFAGGYLFGSFIHYDQSRRIRETRIYVEDYVRLHPEDFQPEPPKYYRDVFQPWCPRR